MKVIVLIFIPMLLVGCVTTQRDIDPLQSEINLLRHQLVKTQQEVSLMRQDLARETDLQLSPVRTNLDFIQQSIADNTLQLNTLSRDISILNNRFDDNQERVSRSEQRIVTTEQSMNQQVELLKTELTQRMDRLERTMLTHPVQTLLPGHTDSTVSEPTTPPLQEIVDPAVLYRTAEQDYFRGQYELSIKGAQEYIRRFPTGAQIASAQFLLADSYLALKRYDEALSEFNIFIQNYSNHDKIPSAMLKRAFIYREKNQISRQQEELKSIVTNYPLSPEAEQALEQLRSSRP